jgi:hypothetical protein
MSVLPAFLLFIFLSPYQVASQTYKNPVLFGDYPDPGDRRGNALYAIIFANNPIYLFPIFPHALCRCPVL